MAEEELEKLRREIDGIDAEMQDLLIRRAEIWKAVRDIKGDSGLKLRPGREAQIMRNLIARHHGDFPKPELIRIWREIFGAAQRVQGPFSVAVFTDDHQPANGSTYWDLARAHFGAYTPMSKFSSARSVIEAVIENECSIGILPLPAQGTDTLQADKPQDSDPWWRYLAVTNNAAGTGGPPRIISRLPFAAPAPSNGGNLEALVIAKTKPEDSGDDGTYLALDLNENVARSPVRQILENVNLDGDIVAVWHDDQPPERWIHLVEISGHLSGEDSRLEKLAREFDKRLNQWIIVGGFANPLKPEELSSDSTG